MPYIIVIPFYSTLFNFIISIFSLCSKRREGECEIPFRSLFVLTLFLFDLSCFSSFFFFPLLHFIIIIISSSSIMKISCCCWWSLLIHEESIDSSWLLAFLSLSLHILPSSLINKDSLSVIFLYYKEAGATLSQVQPYCPLYLQWMGGKVCGQR